MERSEFSRCPVQPFPPPRSLELLGGRREWERCSKGRRVHGEDITGPLIKFVTVFGWLLGPFFYAPGWYPDSSIVCDHSRIICQRSVRVSTIYIVSVLFSWKIRERRKWNESKLMSRTKRKERQKSPFVGDSLTSTKCKSFSKFFSGI